MRDDDILTGPVPDPDTEPTSSERMHAKTFGELVDKTLAGRTPPAMSTDDRALLEVATVIRAASGNVTLSAGKQRSIVEAALQQAVGARASLPGVTPITFARKRWVPWAVATSTSLVAAAALAVLWVRSPAREAPGATVVTPTSWTSRTADPLVGPIPRERAGDAGARLDYIFADRMDGYRDRRLSRGGKR